jgi:hypothetical protein
MDSFLTCSHCGDTSLIEDFDLADESQLNQDTADGSIDEYDFYLLLTMLQCPSCSAYVEG